MAVSFFTIGPLVVVTLTVVWLISSIRAYKEATDKENKERLRKRMKLAIGVSIVVGLLSVLLFIGFIIGVMALGNMT